MRFRTRHSAGNGRRIPTPADHGIRGAGAGSGPPCLGGLPPRHRTRTALGAVPCDSPDIAIGFPETAAFGTAAYGDTRHSHQGRSESGTELCSNRQREVIIPDMRSPVRQTLEQPVEYATKADVQVLAAEIRALRESMEAELRAQREATDARFEKVEAELRAQREATDARFEKVEAELRALRETMEAELRAQRETMAAELRAQRETMAAELRAQREITEARFEKVEGLLEGQHELIRMLSSRIDQVNARIDQVNARIDQVDARFDQVDARIDRVEVRLERMDTRLDRLDARFDSLLKWGVGLLVAAMIGFAGVIFGAARFIAAGGGSG